MRNFRSLFLLTIFFIPLFWAGDGSLFAQRGKNGTPAIATTTVVNEYTSLTANAAAGATSITVANSSLNANVRFPTALTAGDLIMILQVQGATILGAPAGWDPNVGAPKDSTWGTITNYNNCGNWEFAEVYNVPNGTSITLDCPLTYNYTAAGRVVVVRVPRYNSLTINAGGILSCDTWNGTIGGVCAIEVENNTTINAGGSIDITGKGFRGGNLLENISDFGIGEIASNDPKNGAEKGEGIAGYQTDYNVYGGMYCNGAPGNGGGGGNAHNMGGAGGANGGVVAAWNGHGNPDNTNAGWTLAWNLQYTGFAAQTSSGGGQGGYSFSHNTNNQDATVTGPNNAAWGGDSRKPWGGIGGRPLDYSTGRLFLGGGGGSADQNDNQGGRGGNGGALLYLMNYGTVSGAGSIISNGNNGNSSFGTGTGNSYAGDDGAGGAGAGGTLVVNSVGTISGISLTANGGNGGNQVISKGPFYAANSGKVYEAEGPGGGGGGGHIAISNGTPVRTANGGNNGTTNSDGLTEFPPNGATKGGTGTNNAAVTNFIINAPNVTICAGQTATLNATLTGTVPAGTSIIWYDQLVAGNTLGTGATYTVAPVSTTTYYVGTCPGTYHQPVVVTVTTSPLVSAGPNATICGGGNTTLNASGGTSYAWSPSTGLSNATISNPVASPVSTTTYIVTVTGACGTANDTTVVTVASSFTASIAGNTTVCGGSPTTLTASGGGNYSWTTGATTTSITVSPTSNTTYSVIVGSGNCADTASTTVTVANSVNASITGPTAICTGGSATLTASGGSNYLWNTSATASSIVITPTANTSYTVTASSGTCSDTATINVTVGSTINASISGNTTVCGGSSTTLTASGGSNYSWSTGSTNASISVTPTPSSNTTYSVIASSGSCADTTSITVTTLSTLLIFISGNNIICLGDASTLTATLNFSGANSYSWSTGSTATTIVVSPSVTTTYTVYGFTPFCSDTAPVTVTVVPQATATVSPNATICSGQSTTLNVAGGTSYSWSNGSGSSNITVTPSSSSTYTVIAYIGACSDTDSVAVTVLPTPTVTAASNSTICAGDAVPLTASGGNTYVWDNGSTTASISVSPTTTTTYTVFGTSANGCTDTSVVTITVSPPPITTIVGNPNICQGAAATLTATGGGTYLWSSGETTAAINPTASGTYSVVVTIGSCTDTAVATANVVPNPIAGVSPDITIIQGQSTGLSASGGITYVWDNSMNGANITVSPLTTTAYCVTVYDANNCYDTACVTVTVELCSNAGTLYFPNAFSPNGDGDNDSLQIYYGIPQCIEKLHLVVYNRWGEKVYETTNPDFKWSGVYNSGVLKETVKGGHEVYAYYLEVEIVGGSRISKRGNISLVK